MKAFESSPAYQVLGKEDQKILAAFTPEQQAEIRHKQRLLSTLAYFIGKDFRIPVELNEPGEGWYWDVKNNIIRIDPIDLLEKSMDYLQFVICHEGGHRRISRTEFIPLEVWQQPGFSFLMNAIEDPRDNNFVAETYGKFREQMALAYQEDLDFEAKAKEQAAKKLGYQPRFMQAGFEYIKQWFRETQGEELKISEGLPDDVKSAVAATLVSAQDSWWRYPSRKEADESEELIKKYARVSYEINRDEIWPTYKTLVEKDMEDQKAQEFLKNTQKGKATGAGGGGLPKPLKDTLTPKEQKQLEEAIEKAIAEVKKGLSKEKTDGEPESKPIDLSALSEELKKKIKDYVDSLSDEEKKTLAEKAEGALKTFEKDLNKDIEGKLSDDPEKKAERGEVEHQEKANPGPKPKDGKKGTEEMAGQVTRRKQLEAIFKEKEKNTYEQAREKVSDLIDLLTAELRDVFIRRKREKHESGYRSGRRWNVRHRIREKIAGIPLFKSEAREQRGSESEENDYAITLMVDLSGSMGSDGKIEETFKAVTLLAETLNNLNITFEIVGFQDALLEFKSFDEPLDDSMQRKLGGMPLEVEDGNPGGHNNAGDNDDGACLLVASDHLGTRIEKNKFLIVLSDGVPAMDSRKKSPARLHSELKDAVAEVAGARGQKLIGIGLLSSAVAKYYANNIAGVTVQELVEVLGGLLREIIENY